MSLSNSVCLNRYLWDVCDIDQESKAANCVSGCVAAQRNLPAQTAMARQARAQNEFQHKFSHLLSVCHYYISCAASELSHLGNIYVTFLSSLEEKLSWVIQSFILLLPKALTILLIDVFRSTFVVWNMFILHLHFILFSTLCHSV